MNNKWDAFSWGSILDNSVTSQSDTIFFCQKFEIYKSALNLFDGIIANPNPTLVKTSLLIILVQKVLDLVNCWQS